jgi:hypothetical protein
MKKKVIAATLLLAAGCGAEPSLYKVEDRRAVQESALDDAADAEEAIDGAEAARVSEERPSETTADDGASQVEEAARTASWRDALPAVAAPQLPDTLVLGASGAGIGSCAGVPGVIAAAGVFGNAEAAVRRSSGRWYFEAELGAFTEGWPLVGVLASPVDYLFRSAVHSIGVSAASYSPTSAGVLGIAADLDAGVVTFYVDGVRAQESRVLIVPGIGAFRAAAQVMHGDAEVRLNFGADPFRYEAPAGFAAWASGAADANGACLSDADVPAPGATIDVYADETQAAPDATTFQASGGSSPALVVLGIYEAGSNSSWNWGFDDEGNPVVVETGATVSGSVIVDVERAGPIALALSAYEPTDWTVRLAPGAELASVSVHGVHAQTISGVPAGVAVEVRTLCSGGDGGHCLGRSDLDFPVAPHSWPYDLGGGDTQGFVDYIEQRSGLPLDSFAGAYTARRFVVR